MNIQSVIEKSIGEIFGYDIAEKAKEDAYCTGNTRPLYTVGKTSMRILKKFVIPSSIAAAVVIKTEVAKEGTESEPCRPSELPLYEDDICACRPKRKGGAPRVSTVTIEEDASEALEEQIRVIRKELWVWHDRYKGYREKIVEKIEIAKAHSELKESPSMIDQDEDNISKLEKVKCSKCFEQDEFKSKLKTKHKIKPLKDPRKE